jgi:hypothetical protein
VYGRRGRQRALPVASLFHAMHAKRKKQAK